MGLVVINPGLSTTVQDLGRVGYREWGIPRGGAFDTFAAALANALLGNPADCAVLEMTLFGGIYEATIPLALALAGAPLKASIERRGEPARPLVVPQSFAVAPADRLVLGGAIVGARTYLAVQGGWKTRPLLGSRSREERLKPADALEAEPGHAAARRPVEPFWEAPNRTPLRIIAGPDAGLAADLDAWATARFRVGPQISRMGLRLEGPHLDVESPPERLSAPVAPGAVQIAAGQAIVLGIACGTTGGYPHIGHVISADLDRLGQLRGGDVIGFARISVAQARELDLAERRRRANKLRGLTTVARDGLGSLEWRSF